MRKEKPVRFHFPRKKPGCKNGYLSWANENTCCFLCFWRRKMRQSLTLAKAAKSRRREEGAQSKEFQMSLHGVYEEMRDESWVAGIKEKKE